jgi:prophage antirepressor-like protein
LNQPIRFVDGKPVASVLGYADPAKTISTKVKSKNKSVTKLVTPGGIQQVTVLEEAGIYQLIKITCLILVMTRHF